MTKLLTIYFDGAFSAKFSTKPSGKTMDGTQKVWDLKWWHGPPLSPFKILWKSRDARRRYRTKCDFFHFLPAGSAQRAALPVLFLLTGRFSGFSPRRGEALHRSRWNLTQRSGWRHGPPLSPFKISWKSRDTRRRERTKCDVFHFFKFIFLFFCK